MSVTDKANELAEVIKQTEEYENLKSAESRLKLDPTAQDLMQQFQEKQQQVQEAQQNGEEVDQETIQNLQSLQNQMQQNETIQNLMEAQKSFEQVMQQVNDTVTQALSENE